MLYFNPNPCHSFKRHQLLAAPSSAGWDPTKAPAGGSSDAQNGGCGRARPRGGRGGQTPRAWPRLCARRPRGGGALALEPCFAFVFRSRWSFRCRVGPCHALSYSYLPAFCLKSLSEEFKRGCSGDGDFYLRNVFAFAMKWVKRFLK